MIEFAICFRLVSVFTGSSRQLLGFNTEVDESIINCIWERAGVFFPCLRELSLKSLSERRNVRVGLRPYSKSATKKKKYDHLLR